MPLHAGGPQVPAPVNLADAGLTCPTDQYLAVSVLPGLDPRRYQVMINIEMARLPDALEALARQLLAHEEAPQRVARAALWHRAMLRAMGRAEVDA